MDRETIKGIIEAMLFVSGEPLQINIISKVLELKVEDVYSILLELQREYKRKERGIQLIEVNDSFQLCTKPEYHSYIEKLCASSPTRGLSQPTLEVLAIIAYKQPITKYEIDQIRGVKSDKAIYTLLERELIEVKGRLDKIGKPLIYGTTEVFLKCFGFKSIEDLPPIDHFDSKGIFSDYIKE